MEPKCPMSLTCFSSSCWYLLSVSTVRSISSCSPDCQWYSLLAFGVEVDPTDTPNHLVEAYIVEPVKTSPIYLLDLMVWHQKVLLPSHENVLPPCAILVVEVRLLSLFRQRPPRGKAVPMLHVGLLVGTPGLVLRLEGVFRADNLAVEISCQCWVIFRQS